MILWLTACDGPPPAERPAPADSAEVYPEHPAGLAAHVVVVVLDGLRMAESFGTGNSDISGGATEDVLPEMQGVLLPQGTLVRQGLVLGQTITIPAHCDLLTGVRQDFGHFPTNGGLWQYLPVYPTLFEYLSPYARPGELVITGNSDFMEAVSRSVYPGSSEASGASYELVLASGSTDRPEPSDVRALEAVQTRLLDAPWLTVVNLHSIDSAGHYADDPYDYLLRARQADPAVVDLWNWIQSPESGELKDNTTMVVIADHGRHDWGAEEEARLDDIEPPAWRNHGDHCGGCRQIPMFLVGPGIKADTVVDGPYTLEDVGRTIAWMLGVEMPYGTGIVMRDLFVDAPEATDRTGDYEIVVSESTQAVWTWLDEGGHRSTVSVDGEVVSDSTAFAAEAPSVVEQDGAVYACWREYRGADAGGIDWPWIPVCKLRMDGVWTDLTFPESPVTPSWRASLGVDEQGRLLVAWIDNPNTTTYTESRASVRVYRWSQADGWEFTAADPIPAGFPGPISLRLDGTSALLSWAESDMSVRSDNTSGRYTRHIEVQRVDLDGTQVVTPLWRTWGRACPVEAECDEGEPTLDENGEASMRSESPALYAEGEDLQVAWIAWDEAGSHLMLASSTDGGFDWGTLSHLDATGRVLGHIAPVWGGGLVYWARLSDADEVEVCRGGDGAEAQCVGVGSPRISSLSPGTEVVYAAVDQDSGSWSVEEVIW